MLRQRMQHMIQEAYPRADSDLLCGRELCRVRGILLRDYAVFRGFCFLGIGGGGEVVGGFVGGEHAAVEGEGDLDFGLIGCARDRRCARGEGHDGSCLAFGFEGEGDCMWGNS